MRRFAPLLVLGACAALAPAAPVPPPTEKELIAKLWGTTEGAGEFALKGKELTLRNAPEPAQGLIKSAAPTVPRAFRTVTGDFEATVKLIEAGTPNKDAKHADSWPASRAGLFVGGEGHAVELHLYQYYGKFQGKVSADLTRTLWIDTWYPRGGQGSSLKQPEPGKTVHLKLVRRGQTVSGSYSFDGTEWSKPFTPRAELAFPDEVRVGVYLAPTTHQTLAATFADLTVVPLKPDPKE